MTWCARHGCDHQAVGELVAGCEGFPEALIVPSCAEHEPELYRFLAAVWELVKWR